ncbi:DUF397 domain-containing protein [Actinomadura miaoliensis]|uniref:DUF397 domain-containing protein n=1 Tax=Actinomadura miaoliensis TaxID=430685 RepID=A0ABP7WAX3_9ACTN
MRHLAWRKASLSDAHGQCVEVAQAASDVIMTRDSRDPEGPILAMTSQAWRVLLQRVKQGDHDL